MPEQEIVDPLESANAVVAGTTLPTIEAPAPKKRKPRAKPQLAEDGSVTARDLKVKKPKKPKLPMDPRSVFMRRLAEIGDPRSLLRPWMHTKSFKLITTPEELEAWCSKVLNDKSYYRPHITGVDMPVVAVDTETLSLDTRIVKGEFQSKSTGICLSADGKEGIYVSLFHENSQNLDPKEAVRILQPFFDQCHLVFFHAKYDREILRFGVAIPGLKLRPYPYFEDVMVLKYLVDPKADLGDKKKYAGSGSDGLKAMSQIVLGYEQIQFGEIAKVKAKPSPDKASKVIHVPFSWVPTDLALYYAASDAICTWLLWEKYVDEARSIKLPHSIDHKLVDTLAWIERQRFLIDVEQVKASSQWHKETVERIRMELAAIAGEDTATFNPNAAEQVAKVLFEKMGLPVINRSAKTNAPSTDIETLEELFEQYPDNLFLETIIKYRAYAALHPANMKYDERDHTARIYLKQTTVAGGRLAATGGDKKSDDGGCKMNIQAVAKTEGQMMITAKELDLPERINLDEFIAYDESKVDRDCFDKKKGKIHKKIVNNHLVRIFNKWHCVVPECTCCRKDGQPVKVVNPEAECDLNEVLTLRNLFVAPDGWTVFSTDYCNIEMRVAANVSREPKFINEFLHGSGDFHTLTATNVFPEFSLPETPKGKKKELRGMAKTINFALLYGGTEYTIFQNLKATVPGITFEDTKEMVAKYWAGVPIFHAWVTRQQKRAREELICKTPSGRIIKFASAMSSQRIFKPLPEHWDNSRKYWDLIRKAEQYKGTEKELRFLGAAEAMKRDQASGVRNCMDYKKFLGKIQRVAINIPLQGLAGDLMRMSMNRICIWAYNTPGVGGVFKLHASVHDEIDYSVLNAFVPWVVPRVNRLMKLRYLHERNNWPVPIEADCEYGTSWDVEYHLTGDDTHLPSGWTNIAGLEDYIPHGFDPLTAEKLAKLVVNGKHERALEWLRENIHSRVHKAIDIFKKKWAEETPDSTTAKKYITAMLQLHEYWTIDDMEEPEKLPEDQRYVDQIESLQDYAARRSLTIPENTDEVVHSIRECTDVWDPAADENTLDEADFSVPPVATQPQAAQLELPLETASEEATPEEQLDAPSTTPDDIEETTSVCATEPESLPKHEDEEDLDSLFSPEPQVVAVKTEEAQLVHEPTPQPVVTAADNPTKLPQLKPIFSKEEAQALSAALGIGSCIIRVFYEGQVLTLRNVGVDKIPTEFLVNG